MFRDACKKGQKKIQKWRTFAVEWYKILKYVWLHDFTLNIILA